MRQSKSKKENLKQKRRIKLIGHIIRHQGILKNILEVMMEGENCKDTAQ